MVCLLVNRITWQQAGHVTQPGRYMFRFGWLIVTTEDLAIWEQFPDASFALVKSAGAPAGDETDEFHLGVFELGESFERQGKTTHSSA